MGEPQGVEPAREPSFRLHWHYSMAAGLSVPRGMGFGFREEAEALGATRAIADRLAARDGGVVVEAGPGVWRVGPTILSVIACNARCPLRPLPGTGGGDPEGDPPQL